MRSSHRSSYKNANRLRYFIVYTTYNYSVRAKAMIIQVHRENFVPIRDKISIFKVEETVGGGGGKRKGGRRRIAPVINIRSSLHVQILMYRLQVDGMF